ncbi:septum site-determining protein MinC [Leptolinea tardivitalis]|uniref:septum site-determining protein MinC n=1 Tax=Leptolinea tardivitalis TaxID=229920 RepID=UPI0007834144|nr:septum site-determining protein MinC [Leptolinea tardivitalis]GAP20961.1 septum formation inhibitor [Leptolinea tardivitalis]
MFKSAPLTAERSTEFQIKGINDGLLVTLGEGEWSVLREYLLHNIEERSAFFQGARLALDVGDHVLKAAELGALRDKLGDFGISLTAVISSSVVTEKTALMLGIATQIQPVKRLASAPKPVEEPVHVNGETAVFLQKTMRSGTRIQNSGTVVVLGDVNPGAEIIAGGNVIIWGRLKGTVVAGCDGDEHAQVCALEMTPMSLRIANISLDEKPRKSKPGPEFASIESGTVIIQPWKHPTY